MNLSKEMANRGMVVSCSQARRSIGQGAVKVNGEVVTAIDTEATECDTIEIGKHGKISHGKEDANRIGQELDSKSGA